MKARAALLLMLGAAACAGPPRPAPAPAPPPPAAAPAPAATPAPAAAPARARDLTIRRADFAALPGWREADHAAARDAFRASCAALERREDLSGLTRAGDWAAACAAARAGDNARAFFEAEFRPVRVGEGGFATGYFEPELAGARTRSAAFPHPLYRLPDDLVEVDLGRFSDSLKGRRVRGRVEEQRLVPYHDRAAIERGALAGRGLELAFAADPYELFFLHIQGSGRLRLPDGRVMRVGYAGQNGRDYVAIGRVLRDEGALAPGATTMDGILGWLRANPERAQAVMNRNPSYVFFRELEGPGPVGSLGVALTPEVSVAADPNFVPLGAPVFLSTRTADGPLRLLGIAQDTGGAIKGANRFDLFFGAGERARRLAGEQKADVEAVLLLPKTAAERILGAQP